MPDEAELFLKIADEVRRLRAVKGDGNDMDPRFPIPIDWAELFKREVTAEWLVNDVWPSHRQVHLHAIRKTGKSLVALWIACSLAVGRDPFTNRVIEPVTVAYLDYEMTEDDLLERVESMGFDADQLTGRLYYFLHPAIPMLDTKQGGEALFDTLKYYKVQAVVIDTMSRVVEGEENSNDTYIKFYKNTGQLLKAGGIALFRLDHEGHSTGRSRGASAKADDVDVVWQLSATDSGYDFVRKAARISWIPERVSIAKVESPSLHFARVGESWPEGTMQKVYELHQSNVPMDASRRKASEMLKAAGYIPGTTTILQAALNYRLQMKVGG
jgi:hypothetical protein